jgi:hypothetical protein
VEVVEVYLSFVLTRAEITLLKDQDAWQFSPNLTDGSKRALYANNFGLRHFKQPYLILKEKIISDLSGLYMTLNSILFKPFNKKIIQMVESGIMEKVLRQKIKEKEDDQPTVLCIDHLLIWFYLWGGFLLVAGAAFVSEVLTRKIQRIVKKSEVETLRQVKQK